jgi:hypothetical protein
MSDEAEKLATNRDAIVVSITSADEFFDNLIARIEVLDDQAARARRGVEFVAAQAKKYLPNPIDRIRLHDLVHDKVAAGLAAVADPGGWPAPPSAENLRNLVTDIEAASADLVAGLLVLGAFGDEERHRDLAGRSLARLAEPAGETVSGYTNLNEIRLLPALLGMYAIGIGAISTDNWSLLTAVLATTRVNDGQERVLLPLAVRSWAVIDNQLGKALTPEQNYRLPASEWLHTKMGEYAGRALQLSGKAFDEIFDEFEYLIGVLTSTRRFGGSPVGRFAYARRRRGVERWPDRTLHATKWGLVEAYFADDGEILEKFVDDYHEQITRSGVDW